MNDDPQTTAGPGEEQTEQEYQNRRQFFNGLGKWSLAIIAAVTASHDAPPRDVASGTGWWSKTHDAHQQIAAHAEQIHSDLKHRDLAGPKYFDRPHQDWNDYADVMRTKPKAGDKSPGQPLKKR